MCKAECCRKCAAALAVTANPNHNSPERSQAPSTPAVSRRLRSPVPPVQTSLAQVQARSPDILQLDVDYTSFRRWKELE